MGGNKYILRIKSLDVRKYVKSHEENGLHRGRASETSGRKCISHMRWKHSDYRFLLLTISLFCLTLLVLVGLTLLRVRFSDFMISYNTDA